MTASMTVDREGLRRSTAPHLLCERARTLPDAVAFRSKHLGIYRERRWKSLENLALRLGERAKRRRKLVTLSPMSPRDRRVIHLTLEGDPLVTTKSTGRGYFRQVCIVPEEGQRKEKSRTAGRAPTAES